MLKNKSNFVRFTKLQLNNYGAFLGLHNFVFERQRTIIVGPNGSGKTTIVNALANLGPAPEVESNIMANANEMSVEVSTEGNRNLIKRFSRLIFLNCENLINFEEEEIFKTLDNQQQKTIKDETENIFQTLVMKYSQIQIDYGITNTNALPMSERVCLGYASVFAVRKILNLDLPLVLDSPFGMLSIELRNTVNEFLKLQQCQQILLLWEEEIEEEQEIHYKLN